jgi:hypothetical protein
VKGIELRLTSAQIGMYGLLGVKLAPRGGRYETWVERIRDGREMLVRITGVDLGYDPQAWHEHLCASDAGGYRWSNLHLGFPREIARAVADPDWQAAIVQLQGGERENVVKDKG